MMIGFKMLVSERKLRQVIRQVIKEQKKYYSLINTIKVGDRVEILHLPDEYMGYNTQDLAGLNGTIKNIRKDGNCEIEIPGDSQTSAERIVLPCNSEFLEKI